MTVLGVKARGAEIERVAGMGARVDIGDDGAGVIHHEALHHAPTWLTEPKLRRLARRERARVQPPGLGIHAPVLSQPDTEG